MPLPSTEALLSAWEQGRAEPQLLGSALALLGAAFVDADPVSLANCSIGERDAVLLRLQEQLFGGRVSALAVCPGCGERMEFSFDLEDVRVSRPAVANRRLRVSWQQYEVEFRLPNSRDLLALNGTKEIGQNVVELLQRVVLEARFSGRPVSAHELPTEVISLIDSTMQTADPQAEVNLKLQCQSCGHGWSAVFDAGFFLWKEIDAWAVRMLREVHVLARAYGWSEADILAMSAWRRHAYLEMLGV